MDVSHFTGGSSLCKNTMVFSAVHLGYVPPFIFDPDDTISDSISACLFRNVCCLPFGVIGLCCAGCTACINIGSGGAVSHSMYQSIVWWGSHTIWFKGYTRCGELLGCWDTHR
jgi:hypothetical protein